MFVERNNECTKIKFAGLLKINKNVLELNLYASWMQLRTHKDETCMRVKSDQEGVRNKFLSLFKAIVN